MLINQTIENLHALKLTEMAVGLKEQSEQPSYHSLSFEERLGMLVDRELAERENRRLARYLKQAHLRADALVEDVDFRTRRGLERHQLLSLAECAWVRSHHNLAVVGATGLGKTYLACALANAAIRRGHSALYLRGPRLLDELAIARADGRFARLLGTFSRVEVLVVDDYLLRPLSIEQASDVLEVIEDRAGRRSTLLTSQLPISSWHDATGEPTLADAICDRLLQHLHSIELAGQSMRRRGGEQDEEGPVRRGAKQATPPAGQGESKELGSNG